MKSLISNRTWKLVDLPPSCKTIGCKWVLRKNLKPYGSIDKFKARLVAKGFKQKADLDFFDTFSPVTSITSITLLIAIAVIFYLKIHQMDVKKCFSKWGPRGRDLYRNDNGLGSGRVFPYPNSTCESTLKTRTRPD